MKEDTLQSIAKFEQQLEKCGSAKNQPTQPNNEIGAKGRTENAKQSIHRPKVEAIRDQIKNLCARKIGANQTDNIASQIWGLIDEIKACGANLTHWEIEFNKKFSNDDFSKGDYDQKTLDGLLEKFGDNNN